MRQQPLVYQQSQEKRTFSVYRRLWKLVVTTMVRMTMGRMSLPSLKFVSVCQRQTDHDETSMVTSISSNSSGVVLTVAQVDTVHTEISYRCSIRRRECSFQLVENLNLPWLYLIYLRWMSALIDISISPLEILNKKARYRLCYKRLRYQRKKRRSER